MPKTELFGTKSCQFTAELREDLDWRKVDFIEYDVEEDAEALKRMLQLTAGKKTVPVLVKDDKWCKLAGKVEDASSVAARE
jgi:glutaredoxin